MVRWSELIQRGVRSAIQIRARFSGLLVRALWIRDAFSKRLIAAHFGQHIRVCLFAEIRSLDSPFSCSRGPVCLG